MMWQRQQRDVIAIINFYTEASPRKISPTLISLISLFNEDYKNQDEDKNMEILPMTRKDERLSTLSSKSCLSPYSLFLLSPNLGTRFILRGVDL
jgi:hypothetical protein